MKVGEKRCRLPDISDSVPVGALYMENQSDQFRSTKEERSPKHPMEIIVSNSTPQIDRFCVRCRSQIPAKRVARGSCFCSDECRRVDKIERRRARAQKYCRLCHRGLLRKRAAQSSEPAPPVESKPGAPGAHAYQSLAVKESFQVNIDGGQHGKFDPILER